jgi:hypothetical protein
MGYFRQVPNLQYISREQDFNSSLNYSEVKNLFRRAKLREDIFANLSYFTKYQIIGNQRPDNVAYEIYNDPELDWVVLISNNITDVQSEWPLSQNAFYNYLEDKYGSLEATGEIHHYETVEVKNSRNLIVLKSGMEVASDFTFSYYDDVLGYTVTPSNIINEVTILEYEESLEDAKRNIYVLKPTYLRIVLDDIQEIMNYKSSTQYINDKLKKASNIRLT